MSLTWRGLQAYLDRNLTPGFESLLLRDYHTLIQPLAAIDQNDLGVEALLEDANKRRNKIEVEQIIARLQNKPCFLSEHIDLVDSSNTAPDHHPLVAKYQLLARYYFYRRDAAKFAKVIASSIIREWPTKLDSLDGGPEAYVDRQEFVFKIKDTPIRKAQPSYRIRILALRSEDLKRGFVYSGQATTWLAEKLNGRWVTSADGEVIEFDRQGEGKNAPSDGNDEFKDETSTAKKRPVKKSTKNSGEGNTEGECQNGAGSKRVSMEPCSSNRKKGPGATPENFAASVIPPFVTGFNVKNGDTFFWPMNRSEDSFVKAEDKMNNIVFCINSVGILSRKKRSVAHRSYTFLTEITLSILFHGRTIHVNIVDKEIASTENSFYFCVPILSMEFEATTNSSTHTPNNKFFSIIWRCLRSYYERKGEYDQVQELPQTTRSTRNQRQPAPSKAAPIESPVEFINDQPVRRNLSGKSFLYWKHVVPFIEHFFDRRLDVQVRALTISEVRTVLCMILCRVWQPWIFAKTTEQYLDDDECEMLQLEISTAVLNRACDRDIVRGTLRTSFLSKLHEDVYSKVGQDMPNDSTFRIFEEDFTENSVKLNTLEQLDFSIYQWLHGIGEILAGSHLHSEKSRKTQLMFDRCILSLRNHVSAQRTMESILKNIFSRGKAQKVPVAEGVGNTMLIRFNEFRKDALVIHYADYKEKKPKFGSIDAKAIHHKTMNVKGTDSNNITLAVKAGVVDEAKMEARGLYVLLRRAYPLQFARIVERIGSARNETTISSTSSSSTVQPAQKKRSATIVQVVGEKGDNCNPMYDFKLSVANFQEDEVDVEQGPANRPANSGNMDNEEITLTNAITKSVSRLEISDGKQSSRLQYSMQIVQSIQPQGPLQRQAEPSHFQAEAQNMQHMQHDSHQAQASQSYGSFQQGVAMDLFDRIPNPGLSGPSHSVNQQGYTQVSHSSYVGDQQQISSVPLFQPFQQQHQPGPSYVHQPGMSSTQQVHYSNPVSMHDVSAQGVLQHVELMQPPHQHQQQVINPLHAAQLVSPNQQPTTSNTNFDYPFSHDQGSSNAELTNFVNIETLEDWVDYSPNENH